MPIYEYKGLNAKGKQTNGLLDADSPRDLKDRLKRQGIYMSEYVETDRGGKRRKVGGEQTGSKEVSFADMIRRITLLEVAELTRQLATLSRAGIPLVESLAALTDEHENPKLKRVMSQVKRAVSEGSSLANALQAHPTVFPPIYVNMVNAGESSGNLDIVFDRLATLTESQVRLRGKLMGALMYPVIMVFLGGIIITLMMLFVVPKMAEMFEEMGAQLPAVTRILIGFSEFVSDWWPLIFLSLIGSVVGFNRWRVSESGKPTWDAFTLRVPIFGPLIRMLNVARFARTLSTLLASGVPILTAMSIVESIINNHVLSSVVEEAREAVKEGSAVADTLKQSGEFPSMVCHMVAIGERSGELESMLGNVADSYEAHVDSKVMALTSVLEPVMIVVMGGAVAFLVFAILQPMMNMNELFASGGLG
ncbi:MAG: type II secretion system inner membrane protein GspF [Myxococcota bacterium]|nr:type II secretion system inner membrane protein GspF [Myxococcota bacterium]